MSADTVFPAPIFEGSEKRLELDCAPIGRSLPVSASGLRGMTRHQVTLLLDSTGCSIVSSRSCATFDAYVLSESSLFVYKDRFVIKTCGTTRTLALVPQLLQFASDLGLSPTRCKYSRATFLFPEAQPAPYNAWEAEVALLDQLFGHIGSSHSCTLGCAEPGSLQWHVYVVQAQQPYLQQASASCSVEICSTGLCPQQAISFHRDDSNFISAAQTTAKTGIRSLLPDADIDDYLFEPCGYSMNGLENDGVASTIHITPEENCSFASLEVSGPLQASSMTALVQDPLHAVRGAAAIFRPSNMAVAISCSTDAMACSKSAVSRPAGYRQIGSWVEHLPNGGIVSFFQFRRVAAPEQLSIAHAVADCSHARAEAPLSCCSTMQASAKQGSSTQGQLSATASTVSMADFGSASTRSFLSDDTDMSDAPSDVSEKTHLGDSWLVLDAAAPSAPSSGCSTPSSEALGPTLGLSSAAVSPRPSFESTCSSQQASCSFCAPSCSPAELSVGGQAVEHAAPSVQQAADAVARVLEKFQAERIPLGTAASVDAYMADKIASDNLEDPIWVVDLGAVQRLHQAWQEAMPRVRPFYAAKCNMDPALLATLSSLGAGFDCASEAELRAAVAAGADPGKDIVFANACKRPRDIRAAASMGVNLTTLDTPCEVQKLAQHHPGTSALLRIRADDPDARCQLGNKYGAELEDCEALYVAAKQHNVAIRGISFHVGSGATNPVAFAQAIAMAKKVFIAGQQHGFHMTMLDIGGGFCGGIFGPDGKVDLGGVPAAVNAALEEHFPPSTGVDIIAEPGRYFAEAPFTLGCMVFGEREGRTPVGQPCFDYWITDGLYGAMNSLLYDHATLSTSPLGQPHHAASGWGSGDFSSTVFGPSCDGLDTLVRGVPLPRLHVGDWLVFSKMGAYTMTGASAFNGFDPADAAVFYVHSEA